MESAYLADLIREQGIKTRKKFSEFAADLSTKLDQALAGINAVQQSENHMTVEVDNLTTAVANDTTVDESAITLLNGLSAQITSLKNDPVKLQALADSLTSESGKLAAAVTANTPAAPAPVSTPAP